MTDTRVYSNKRRTIWAAPDSANPFADETAVTDDEINAMLNISSVTKWDSSDLAVQESDQIDDRVLTDSAGAQRRGFIQFGGGLNLLTPRDLANVVDAAVKAFALFRTPRTVLWIVDRALYPNNTPALPGQRANVYRIAVDAQKNQTSGDTSYSYTVKLVPQGDVFPQQIIADTTPAPITVTGHSATLSLATNAYTWGVAKLSGATVTNQAEWKSSAPDIASVDNRGLVTALKVGTAQITASYPGATDSAPVSINVTA